MIEAVFVISIFILFFVGMLYFESLYHTKIRVQGLARAAAVAYAMDACKDANPLQTVQQDLHASTGHGDSPPPSSTATVPVGTPNKPVGNNGGDPLGSAMKSQGLAGDPTTDIGVNGTASGTTGKPGSGFHASVSSDSYLSCGDAQGDGSAGSAWSFVKNSIQW